jgi:hypothetical protein
MRPQLRPGATAAFSGRPCLRSCGVPGGRSARARDRSADPPVEVYQVVARGTVAPILDSLEDVLTGGSDLSAPSPEVEVSLLTSVRWTAKTEIARSVSIEVRFST